MADGRGCSGNNPVKDLLQNCLSDHLMDLKRTEEPIKHSLVTYNCIHTLGRMKSSLDMGKTSVFISKTDTMRITWKTGSLNATLKQPCLGTYRDPYNEHEPAMKMSLHILFNIKQEWLHLGIHYMPTLTLLTGRTFNVKFISPWKCLKT